MSEAAVPPLPSRRFLTRSQAAAYLGVSPRTFDAEVSAGVWPRAMRRGSKESALTWDRRLLDRAADRLAGLVDSGAAGSDLTGGEIQALERAARGSTAPKRPEHRHPKAA